MRPLLLKQIDQALVRFAIDALNCAGVEPDQCGCADHGEVGQLEPVLEILFDVAQQFYFANKQASWDDFGDAGMGLTRTEFDIVRALTPAAVSSF